MVLKEYLVTPINEFDFLELDFVWVVVRLCLLFITFSKCVLTNFGFFNTIPVLFFRDLTYLKSYNQLYKPTLLYMLRYGASSLLNHSINYKKVTYLATFSAIFSLSSSFKNIFWEVLS